MAGTRRHNLALGRNGPGFTLLELMVVISIMVILTGITVPIGKSLREGNSMMACASRLHAIHQAMRMYYLDERGVPPYQLGPGADPSDPSTEPVGPGLWVLYEAGYMSKRDNLHCPHHMAVQLDNPRYFRSYQMRDPMAKYDTSNPLSALNQFKYLPYRGVDNPNDPDYRRQLCRGAGAMPIYDPSWQPDDTAVVCWCDWHANSYKRGGEYQYQVLFWGGEVKAKPRSLLRDSSMAPIEAWRVRPES
ncbi:MAG: type II secretion system protein [Armatimonadetes bacterium]|nr:type II secretion system protein [Armatimonadota bacterium]